MRCDICERQMVRRNQPASPGSSDEVWSCRWCYAVTMFRNRFFEICRPPYEEIEYRWERAYSYELFDNVDHAYADTHQTLCGITHPDISSTPWFWYHPSGSPCPDCFATARIIDERWPADRRGESDRHSVRAKQPPGSPSHQPAIDWDSVPDDQLGRPDLVLPSNEPDRYVRPPDAAEQPERVDATPFPASWYGTHLDIYRPWTWDTPAGRPMDQLPILDPGAFTGDYSWMGGICEPIGLRVAQLTRITAELNDAGLVLPPDFAALATGTNPHTALDRSGSFMELTGPLINPAEPGARLIRFLHEQARSWYLYLRPDGDSFIVCSSDDFEAAQEERLRQQEEDGSPENMIYWCAPSAEVFTYRYRAETLLARAIRSGERARDLPPELRAYLAAALQLSAA